MQVRLYRNDEVPPTVGSIFNEVRDALGIPWTPSIFRALAAYPAYLELLWPQLRPNLDQAGFALSAAFIADRALDFIRDIYEPTYTPSEAVGAVESDEATLAETLAALRYGLPQALLIGGALLEALKFEEAGGKGRPGGREWSHPERLLRHAPLVLVDEEGAEPGVRTIYQEIRTVTTLPFVPDEFRAIGRWPEYLSLSWGDLRHLIPHPVYRRRRRSLSYYAAGGTHYLSVPIRIGRDAIEQAGITGHDVQALKQILQLFAAALPGELLNVMALEHGLHPRPPDGPR